MSTGWIKLPPRSSLGFRPTHRCEHETTRALELMEPGTTAIASGHDDSLRSSAQPVDTTVVAAIDDDDTASAVRANAPGQLELMQLTAATITAGNERAFLGAVGPANNTVVAHLAAAFRHKQSLCVHCHSARPIQMLEPLSCGPASGQDTLLRTRIPPRNAVVLEVRNKNSAVRADCNTIRA